MGRHDRYSLIIMVGRKHRRFSGPGGPAQNQIKIRGGSGFYGIKSTSINSNNEYFPISTRLLHRVGTTHGHGH
jgi:hypothetical protein